MSIASEITRLQGVKSDILQAIANKGVTVPAGSALDDCPALIASIPTGGSLPAGYQQCQYVKNVAPGQIFSQGGAPYLITDVSKDDIITFYYEISKDATSWIPEVKIISYYFSDTRSSRGIRVRTNSSENSTIINGFNTNQTLSGLLKSVLVTRYGNTSFDINGVSYSDSYPGNTLRNLDLIFYVDNAAVAGGKLFYLRIYSIDKVLKHEFLPMKKNSTTDVLYDTVSGIEFVLDNTKFVNGPVMV